MLARPNQSGIFTVSINPSIGTQAVTQTTLSTVPSIHVLPQQTQQVPQRHMSHLVSGSQVVNVTPVRVSQPNTISTTPNKSYTCSYCHKNFSSRYNVTRHEKICKLNTNTPVTIQQQIITPTTENKLFLCMFCQKNFSSQDSLTRHLKKCKSANGNTLVLGNHVATPASQQNHGRRLHICKYCAKQFSTKWNVIRHEKLFHDPNDPILVPQSSANGLSIPIALASPPGKPERYCRFCGNYFSSKYNAIRHEKICTRVPDNSNSNPEQNNQLSQVQQQALAQQSTVQKTIQITTINSTVQGHPPSFIIPNQSQQQQQQQQHQQQSNQQQQQNQQIPQQSHQHITQQVQQGHLAQAALQNNQQQQQQLLPQTMLLIEQPNTPFHVCKFCNKQLSTRCDPVSHNIIPNVPRVATITGQSMQLPIGSSGAPLTGLVAPVMASLPQVTLVQPQLPPIQGQQLIQQQTQLHQAKERMPHQANQQQAANNQPTQVNIQRICLPQQQIDSLEAHIQANPQQHEAVIQVQQQQQQQQPNGQAQQIERPHACKFCDKHFATKWYLDQHEKIHTGEADMCKECGKYFVTRWHLDKHMRVHLTGAPASKKSKKDTPATSVIMSTNNSMPTEVQGIGFSQDIMIGPGVTTMAGIRQSSPVNQSGTITSGQNTQSTPNSFLFSAVSTPYFVAGADQTTSQAVSVLSNPQVSTHSDEHSTIDKSQIANTLPISYSMP